MNSSQAIGIFDSGIGGLSITKRIAEQLPCEHLLYVADSAHAPYGNFATVDITRRVNHIADWLVARQCKAIVVACNTATVNVIDELRARINIPIIGVEPAIKPAAQQSQTKKIAILATQATATNQRFLSLVAEHKNGSDVFIQPCPGLVELIEQGELTSETCQSLLKQYLEPLIDKNIDKLVLGCTHYPFVSDTIKQIIGADIQLIETATPVTLQLRRQLEKYNLLTTRTSSGDHQFYSSLASPAQQRLFSQLWQSDIQLRSLDC